MSEAPDKYLTRFVPRILNLNLFISDTSTEVSYIKNTSDILTTDQEVLKDIKIQSLLPLQTEPHRRIIDAIIHLMNDHDFDDPNKNFRYGEGSTAVTIPILKISPYQLLKLCHCPEWIRNNGKKDFQQSYKIGFMTALADFFTKKLSIVCPYKEPKTKKIPHTNKTKKVKNTEYKVRRGALFLNLEEELPLEVREKKGIVTEDNSIITIIPNWMFLDGGYVNRPVKYEEIIEQSRGTGKNRKQRLEMMMNYITYRANSEHKDSSAFKVEEKNLAGVIGLNRDIKNRDKKAIKRKIKEALEDAKYFIKGWETYTNIHKETIYQIHFDKKDFRKNSGGKKVIKKLLI